MITFEEISLPLEAAIGVVVFEVTYRGSLKEVVRTKSDFDNFVWRELPENDRTQPAIGELKAHLLCNTADDIIERIRNTLVSNEGMQGYQFSGDKDGGCIHTPFEPRTVDCLRTMLKAVSKACVRGLPVHIGVALLQEAIKKGLSFVNYSDDDGNWT